MNYISTRLSPDRIPFNRVVLSSASPDGGLYVPEYYPDVTDSLANFAKLSYSELAYEIIRLYTDAEIEDGDLKTLIDKSYSGFAGDDIAPMREVGNFSVLELFHGPTYAFKDFALQFLGNLFEYFLEKKNTHLNLLGATSGDTGSAAIHGVKGKTGINLFMIHPHNGVSRIQKLQMTSVREPNIFNIAIAGTFDDGQRIVKDIFSDVDFCAKYAIGSVNSINWGRIVAQTVYYFYAGLQFLKRYPGHDLIFSVPTGNFGNIFAGYVAKRMGLPIHKLICATNSNNILHNALKTGIYKTGNVQKTLSPSMDIQVSSNFERLLFEISNRNKHSIVSAFSGLKEHGKFKIEPDHLTSIREFFISDYASDDDTIHTINDIYGNFDYICDPHTAVGIFCAKKCVDGPFIGMATAHYGKFPETYRQCPDIDPDIPESMKQLANADAFYKKLSADTDKIKNYIIHSLEN